MSFRHLEVVVSSGEGERDSYALPLGLREVKLAGNGLLVNGQKFQPKILRRVNDSAASGGAANAAALEADVKWAKANGYDTLYLPDGTTHPYLLDLADRYGLFVLGQAPAEGGSPQLSTEMAEVARIEQNLGFHASYLGNGVGAGLDVKDAKVNNYLAQSSPPGLVFYTTPVEPDRLVFLGGGELDVRNAPYLADYLANKPSFSGSGFVSTHLRPVGILNRARGEKAQVSGVAAKANVPAGLPLVAGAIALVLVLQSPGLGNLRFASLAQTKFKRKVRRQVKGQAYWYLLRLAVLALIAERLRSVSSQPVADFWLERIPAHSLQVLAWYLLATPWALFLSIFAAGLTLSMLLAWPRARSFEGRPGTVALLLWLEKGKRWIVLVIAAWIFAGYYAGSMWLVWAAAGLSWFFSWRATAKNLHWAGGKTYNLVYFGALVNSALVFAGLNWESLKYFYHWVKL